MGSCSGTEGSELDGSTSKQFLNQQFQSDSGGGREGLGPGMETAIHLLRQQLLDISKRNRLTNTPVGKRRVKQLEVEDERSNEVFRILYLQRKKMTFEAFRGGAAPEEGGLGSIYVPSDDETEASLAAHHVDRKLQTRLTAEVLQKRLLSLHRDARGIEEEQGVSVLYLALGFLRWYESESSEIERFAPLVLLPVDLERDSARGRFRLAYRDQDLESNLSLGAMLKNDFELKLPEFSEGDDWLPSEYFERTRSAVSSQPRWRVEANTIVLGFYSFAKFLMWRDLAPDNEWGSEGGLTGNPLVKDLLLGGFDDVGPDIDAPDENLDERFPDPAELGHILDADASQTRVIAGAREGRNLVVQGPPGTGKSQTIANIIAVAARDGKRVLFVAEKRAALDVVHARLEKCGLDPLCLELHSHKAVRKHVYGDLKRALELGSPIAVSDHHYERVRSVRDELNRLSALLHQVDSGTGETPYGVIGRLSMLDESGYSRPDFGVEGADGWTREEFGRRRDAVEALARMTAEHGSEREHPWRGAQKRLTHVDRRALAERVRRALGLLESLRTSLARAAQAVSFGDAECLLAAGLAAERLDGFAAAPDLVPSLLKANAVVDHPGSLLKLCEDVARLQSLRADLLKDLAESALDVEWAETRLAIAAHGTSLFRWLNGAYRGAVARLRAVARVGLPKDLGGRLAVLDRLLAYGRQRRAVARDGSLGREAFPDTWRGEDTDLSQSLPALGWIAAQAKALGSGAAVKRWFEAVPQGLDCLAVAGGLRADAEEWNGAWKAVVELTDLDVATAFDVDQVEAVDSALLVDRLDSWLARMDTYEALLSHKLQGSASCSCAFPGHGGSRWGCSRSLSVRRSKRLSWSRRRISLSLHLRRFENFR